MADNNSPRNARFCIRDIIKSYNSAPVLTGISLITEPGETVTVTGPSGSGKLTLPHCTSDVLLSDDGDVIFGDAKTDSSSDADRSALHLYDFGFVFQDSQLLPELTTREDVALPMILQGRKRLKSLGLADDVLNHLGLTDLTRRHPGQMSGGRAQHVTITRAMAGEPDVIFTDEPTGVLNQPVGHEVMQQLIALVEQTGTTLVMVTHGVKMADWCRRRVEIRNGLIHSDRMLAGAEVTE